VRPPGVPDRRLRPPRAPRPPFQHGRHLRADRASAGRSP
jgi:hypothetical protein